MNMEFYRKLPIPKEIKEQYPVTEEMAKVKAHTDEEIRKGFQKTAVIICQLVLFGIKLMHDAYMIDG